MFTFMYSSSEVYRSPWWSNIKTLMFTKKNIENFGTKQFRVERLEYGSW